MGSVHDKPLKVAMVSLGCPKNLVDSEKMLAALAAGGCLVAAPLDQADVIVVKTCGFLSSARDESLGVIAEALDHKRRGSARRVVVAGCLGNRDAEKLYDLSPDIDAIVGVNDRDTILSAVLGKGPVSRVRQHPPARTGGQAAKGRAPVIASDAGRFRLTPRHTAYLRIAEGCSQRCTFCTIPALRGPFRSKLPRSILAEARELLGDGARELNIIGQDITSYGRDLDGKANLSTLLGRLDTLDGARWLRLMYAYPKRFDPELIDTMAAASHVLHYVDLPLQHIANPVLRRMGRAVTRKETELLLRRLRAAMPDVTIRTTFIVGFPGEGRGEFGELLDFVRDFEFDALGVFEFSPEQGTPAASMGPAVTPRTKARRAEAIMLAQQEIAFAANRRRIGRVLEVLVDGLDSAGRCVGRHGGQAPDIDSVCYLTVPRPGGRFVRVKVIDWQDYDLIVQPLD